MLSWHSRHLRMCESGEPAQSSRPGSCGGTAAVRLFDRSRLSEACRCVMKKLPFAPNLEARAACCLSIDARWRHCAKGFRRIVARCGGVVHFVLQHNGQSTSRFGGGQPPLTADGPHAGRRSTNGGTSHAATFVSRRSAVQSHSLSIDALLYTHGFCCRCRSRTPKMCKMRAGCSSR